MKFIAAFLALLSLAAPARELDWRPLDALGGGDRPLAEQTLYPMFGDNPALWPDWIDAAGLYVPAAPNWMLVVRRPVHEECGQYRFAFFGPVTTAGKRAELGEFCACDIEFIQAAGRDWPDFQIKDQRLRWHDGRWWKVLN